MRRSLPLVALVAVLCCGVLHPTAAEPTAKPPAFQDTIRPILQRCVGCHSGDTPGGGLTLSTREQALKGGESGAALKPGDAARSLLYTMAADRKMPPKKPLSVAELDVLRHWIDGGATWEGEVKKRSVADAGRAGADWWSLQKVQRPEPPPVQDKAWVRGPLDAFVLAELEKHKLRPSPPAERAELLRRVTYDLHGLPSTPEEIDAFLNDKSPDAYEKVIDRLLASPRYGERWGRHWLDVVRFAESHGFERDQIRDHAWRYRDYVIRSFNDDKPYPQFIKEQLAGDALEPCTNDGICATGFLTAGPWDEVGNNVTASAVLKLRVREEELEDMLAGVGQTFLGLTVNCARCHDHKFDPISQRDYYRVKAVFEGVRFGDRPLTSPELARGQQRLTDLEKQLAGLVQPVRARLEQDLGQPRVEGVPAPLARWTFDKDAKDDGGVMHGELLGGAVIENGRLKLNGKTAFLRTAPLPRDVKEKTLEAWVSLATLAQGGGGVLTLETKDGGTFDSLVYGERVAKQWMAGSDFYRRTRNLTGPEENTPTNELVHVAAVYTADNRVAVYRNGTAYGESYVPTGDQGTLRTYAAKESRVLLGLRHTGGGKAFFAGEIAEARLYDKALSQEQVAASYKAGVNKVALAQVLAQFSAEQRDQYDKLQKQLDVERAALTAAKVPQLVWAAMPSKPAPTHVLLRGDVEKQGDLVHAAPLSLGQEAPPDFDLPADAPEGARRLHFAEWVASADNPLTARVLVNRVWHYHFGHGLVASPNDFGFNGERPTHPQLLDWLASEFVAHGWSIKKLHRLILLSATYRQAATFNPAAAEIDVDNHLLWRFRPRRLEGEAVRDAMLMVSGRLNEAGGGPSFRPFTVTIFNSHFYTLREDDKAEFNRRTVYRMNVNSARSPMLELFDCPDPSTKTPRRTVTTTPLQALSLMNNVFVQRSARYLAERLQRESGDDTTIQVRQAYRFTFGRAPSDAETERAAKLVREHGLEQLCWVLLNASEFLYVR